MGFVGSPRDFLDFDICLQFDHPRHLKSGVSPARVQIHIFRSCKFFFFLGGGGGGWRGGGHSSGVRRSDLSMIIIYQWSGFDSYWVVLSCDSIYYAIQGGSNI